MSDFNFILTLDIACQLGKSLGRESHRKEDKNIALRLGCMDLENGGDGCVEVVGLGLRGVVDIDLVSATGN